jgi:hypothetical protein
MANQYQINDPVFIRDGDQQVQLIDDHHQKHFIDIPEGTHGVVSEVVFGGAVYLVRTTVNDAGRFVTGTGMFAETVLADQ